MGRKKPFEIAGKWFPTKGEAKEYVRSIVDRYEIGDSLKYDDHVFIEDLLSLHPEFEQKHQGKLKCFTVEVDPVWKKTKHFIIHRTDGTSTDFSWHTCFDGKSHRKEVLSAMRHAISEDIFAFKLRELETNPVCPFRNIGLTIDNSHVDHVPPQTFAVLAQGWLACQPSLETIELKESHDNQWICEFKNEFDRDSWIQFHQITATLRLISAAANLSDVKLAKR